MMKHFTYTFCITSLTLLFGCGGNSGGSNAENNPSQICEIEGIYVDATSGSDSNAGTNSCEPWQSLFHTFANISDGATVFLKRGETWGEGIIIENSQIEIDAYGAGSPPLLSGSVRVSDWTSQGDAIFSAAPILTLGQILGHVTQNDEVMFFQEWNTDAQTSLTSAPNDSFTYDNSTNTVYIKISDDPSEHSYAVSVEARGVYVDGFSGISINNIHIDGFSLHGIEFKNCDTCSAEDVVIEQIGGATISDGSGNPVYAGNGIEFTNSSNNGRVENTTISEVFDSCLSPQTYASNQTLSNILFSNSVVSECGFAGIEISVLSNGGSTSSQIRTIEIDGLIIEQSGKGWSGQRFNSEGYGIRIQSDSGAGSVSGVDIRRSEISGSVNSGIRGTGDVNHIEIEQSRIYNNDNHGIDISEPTQSSPLLNLSASVISGNNNYGINFNCASCQGLQILHNTFYENGVINLAIFNQDNLAEIKNNVFNSENNMTHIFSNNSLIGVTLDHNCYTTHTNMFGYGGETYSDLSSFTSAESLETNGVTNVIVQVAAPLERNYQLIDGSVCIGIGDIMSNITEDFLGAPYSSPPSAGAFAR
ncbi:MAG: right-handed parallel beta-helix repeat-containing protein [Agarilytica sp.]